MSVFFTSDLHFGHNNLCNGIRGMTVDESDNLIITNWNNVVHKKDIVYILGDVTMEQHKYIPKYMSQLEGEIRVVVGNHDTIRVCKELNRLGIVTIGTLEYKGFICTHIPIIESELKFYKGNLHGHWHIGCNSFSDNPKYFNVNCEFHNYTPINFEEIVEQINIKINNNK